MEDHRSSSLIRRNASIKRNLPSSTWVTQGYSSHRKGRLNAVSTCCRVVLTDTHLIRPSLCLVQPLWLVPESSGKDPDGADSVPCLAWKDVPGSSCTCLGSALESAISDYSNGEAGRCWDESCENRKRPRHQPALTCRNL